jgi:nucleoside-diphosphate-sugar epimerase
MNPVLVTGGTGHLGRDIVRRLVEKGHPVRVFARSPGPETDVEWATGDLATGDGPAPALQDVRTVINAATYSPARGGGFRPVDFFKSPAEVDVDGTRRILALCEAAGVQHFLHVSIVDWTTPRYPTRGSKSLGSDSSVNRLYPGRSRGRCRSIIFSSDCSTG